MSITMGIDVSKDKLDVFYGSKQISIRNAEEDIRAFFKECEKETRVVMEATGKYHRKCHKILFELGFKVMVINPYQSRHFARAMNVLCKTDKIDAKVLALFGEKMDFHETIPHCEIEEKLQELSRHLVDLKGTKSRVERQMETALGFAATSLKKVLTTLNEEIKGTEKELENIVESDEESRKNCELLETIPGVGKATAIMLMSNVKELGKVGKNEVAALTGLAPINNDSGKFSGKRHIRGGRHDVRVGLYMPILGASTKHNKRLKEIYERLVLAGKCKKVALVACMRKLIVWVNAILKTQQPWSETRAY